MPTAKGIATLAVAFFVAAIVIPLGLQQVATANMTGVNAAVASIFTILLPILMIIGVALKFLPGGKE